MFRLRVPLWVSPSSRPSDALPPSAAKLSSLRLRGAAPELQIQPRHGRGQREQQPPHTLKPLVTGDPYIHIPIGLLLFINPVMFSFALSQIISKV